MNRNIIYSKDIFLKINELIEKNKFELIFILCDINTEKHCLPYLKSNLKTKAELHQFTVDAGENSKNLRNAELIWSNLIEIRQSRKILMVNLGGGMVSDLGGFIASTFMRGIEFINIPTTLLAMVDASIGGKTGINLNATKNIVGAFSFPLATYIHTDFLNTLENREFRSGLAEMLKHGLIQSKNHWRNICSITNINAVAIKDYIHDSTLIKVNIVEQDPGDKGIRKILNFGHTIGHAIESEYMDTKEYLLHGEAIAIGMLIESLLSHELKMLNNEDLDEIFKNILRIFPKTKIPKKTIPQLIDKMKLDKKNKENQINFSLIKGIGDCEFDVFVDEKSIHEAIENYNLKLDVH